MRRLLVMNALVLAGACGAGARQAEAPQPDTRSGSSLPMDARHQASAAPLDRAAPTAQPSTPAPAQVTGSDAQQVLHVWPASPFDPYPPSVRSRAEATAQLARLDADLPQAAPLARPGMLERRAGLLLELARTEPTRDAFMAAVAAFSSLAQEYSRHARRDHWLYATALGYDVLGDVEEERKALMLVLKEYPTPPWLHATYFQFGVMMARVATREPERWTLVARTFERAATSTNPAIATEAKKRAADALRLAEGAAAGPRPIAD